MKNYDDFELNCKDDCSCCEVKLECEYLTADGKAKEAALAKLAERDEKEEAARKAEEQAKEKAAEQETEVVAEVIDTNSPAEELAEAADEATEETEEQAEEEKPVEEIKEEVTEENGETVETEEVIDTDSPALELAEAADEATEETEEQAEEETAEEVKEEILETADDTDAPAEVQAETESEQTATEEQTEQAEQTAEQPAEVAPATEEKPAKTAFKLTPPENYEELNAAMCTKRARKLIFRPNEAIYDKTFTVLGTDKKNEEGIKVKDILDAEIKQGLKLGYIDKFDGLKTSEIKEEYENDVVYEYAEQEFKKVGVIYDGKKIKVYVYDFDGKACHHVGYIDETEAADVIPYLIDKEKYSFALDGIITGGNAKRVTKDENGKITVTKEKGGAIGLELDVTIIPRKD